MLTEKSNKLTPTFSTSIDKDDNLLITVYITGVNKEKVKLKKTKKTLTVLFTREQPEDVEYDESNITFGDFGKSFIVPDLYDLKKISTTVENGVLLITIAPDEEHIQTISL